MDIKFCEEDGITMMEEKLVIYKDCGRQIMMVNSRAPVSLAGQKLLEQYLKELGWTMKEIES